MKEKGVRSRKKRRRCEEEKKKLKEKGVGRGKR